MAIHFERYFRTSFLQQLLLLLIIQLVSIAQTGPVKLSKTEMNLCGPGKITLSAQKPEHTLVFPDHDDDDDDDDDDEESQKHSIDEKSAPQQQLKHSNHSNRSTAHNRSSHKNDVLPRKGLLSYRCRWVITTESNHAITAIFDFSSENGYTLSAEDDFGYIDNCTTKRCLIESSTPALSLEFHTTELNAEPLTRFSAKLYSTLAASEDRQPLTDWWIVLLIISTILLIFVSFLYLFYMKRNLLLSRLFRLLNSGETSPKSTQSKAKVPLANNNSQHQTPLPPTSPTTTTTPTTICRRQYRTSVSSLHATHFEPMPTIAEEDTEVAESESTTTSTTTNSYLERQQAQAIRVV